LAEAYSPEKASRRWLNDIATLEQELNAVSPLEADGMKIFEAFL
jgi:hypothetical protein